MLANQRFLVQVRLVVMRRGELSVVITRLMSKCLWSGWIRKKGVKDSLINSLPLFLPSCASLIFATENPDRKRNPKNKKCRNITAVHKFGVCYQWGVKRYKMRYKNWHCSDCPCNKDMSNFCWWCRRISAEMFLLRDSL